MFNGRPPTPYSCQKFHQEVPSGTRGTADQCHGNQHEPTTGEHAGCVLCATPGARPHDDSRSQQMRPNPVVLLLLLYSLDSEALGQPFRKAGRHELALGYIYNAGVCAKGLVAKFGAVGCGGNRRPAIFVDWIPVHSEKLSIHVVLTSRHGDPRVRTFYWPGKARQGLMTTRPPHRPGRRQALANLGKP